MPRAGSTLASWMAFVSPSYHLIAGWSGKWSGMSRTQADNTRSISASADGAGADSGLPTSPPPPRVLSPGCSTMGLKAVGGHAIECPSVAELKAHLPPGHPSPTVEQVALKSTNA